MPRPPTRTPRTVRPLLMRIHFYAGLFVGPFVLLAASETATSWPASVDTVAVDARTGTVTERVDFDDWPLAARLARWGIQLHMGFLFGAWNQVALILLAGGIGTMAVSGYRMWWLRRPTRGHRLRIARPVARGAWRRAPAAVVVALVVTATCVGWILPMLGISLLGFLAVDLVVGLPGRRRRPPEGRSEPAQEQPAAAR